MLACCRCLGVETTTVGVAPKNSLEAGIYPVADQAMAPKTQRFPSFLIQQVYIMTNSFCWVSGREEDFVKEGGTSLLKFVVPLTPKYYNKQTKSVRNFWCLCLQYLGGHNRFLIFL